MKNNELDGATSHTAKLFQNWCKENCPAFIKKDEWPPSLPDLNPLNFSTWSILKANVNKIPHKNLAIEWEKIPFKCNLCFNKCFSDCRKLLIRKGDILNNPWTI